MRRAPRRRRPGGYLLVLVAVCVSLLSISFLRLAADAAKVDDRAELEVAQQMAAYAAESGLLLARQQLVRGSELPPVGPWLMGTLELSQARYSVEVRSHEDSASGLTLLCTGRSEAGAGQVVTSVLEAGLRKGKKGDWQVQARRRP